jgi:5-methylcytosine-specific restriction endonuclease McrA
VRLVMGELEVEHIIPRALGGGNDEFNLAIEKSFD